MTTLEKCKGSLFGLAVGDALGAPIEGLSPGSFIPLTDMVGGGRFNLQPGQWTDDTSMALCLAESLIKHNGFNEGDQMQRYVRWWKFGHLSSTKNCFDIGSTVRKALKEYLITREPYSGPTDPKSAGNGSLMRLSPIPIIYSKNPELCIKYSALSSKTTHGAQECIDSCQYLAGLILGALQGVSKDELLSPLYCPIKDQWKQNLLSKNVENVAAGSYKELNPPSIAGTGYVVKCLEAALWAFHNSSSFEEGCLLAVNLGDDADTTGAVFGQLAGAYYGFSKIPSTWLNKIARAGKIESFAQRLYALS